MECWCPPTWMDLTEIAQERHACLRTASKHQQCSISDPPLTHKNTHVHKHYPATWGRKKKCSVSEFTSRTPAAFPNYPLIREMGVHAKVGWVGNSRESRKGLNRRYRCLDGSVNNYSCLLSWQILALKSSTKGPQTSVMRKVLKSSPSKTFCETASALAHIHHGTNKPMVSSLSKKQAH